jgi:hypothetical protein
LSPRTLRVSTRYHHQISAIAIPDCPTVDIAARRCMHREA